MTEAVLKLGTRASPLALAQAEMVKNALLKAHGWAADHVQIIAMTASGDRILDRPLAEVGGKALWTKELDRALFVQQIDFAVHSMKDVETIRPEGLTITAMLPRADVRDRLIGAASVSALPKGARVGTSSPRRTAQLLRLRTDISIVLFRGNVATRLAKLKSGEAEATLLAAAGLDRLGMANIGTAISIEDMLPAPSQGAIGIETRTDDTRVQKLLEPINHAPTFKCVMAERAFLKELKADCHSPVAAHAQIENGKLFIRGEIFSEDGQLHESGRSDDPVQLAQTLLARAKPDLRKVFG